MIKHYLKTALRNFKTNRLIFWGSITTVFLCTLCISLLFVYVHNELTMDNFHKREKDIYLMTVQQSPESLPEAIDAALFFDFDYKKYPELKNLVNIKKYKENEIKFTFNNNTFSPEGMVVDSTFFEVFDFKLKVGDRETVLYDPEAAVFTERFAKLIFGNENPIGKNVTVTDNRKKIFTVKGIIEEPPANSSLTYDFILPSHSSRFSRSGGNFILVNNNFDPNNFTKKVKEIGHSHSQFKNSQTGVMPFESIYIAGRGLDLNGIFTKFGDKKTINILFAIIGVIFVISLLNFSNLQIININSSVKNIGIHKISGAGGKHIFYQKLNEILILILVSTVLITLVFLLVLPFFNRFTGVKLAPEIWQIFLLNIVILTLLTLFAMIYPTLVFLRIPITNSLKNQLFSETKLAGRKIVATIQFALSFVLLIASMVVGKQLDLMLSKDLGFSSESILSTQMFHQPHFSGTREEQMKRWKTANSNYQIVQDELNAQSFVRNYSQGNFPVNPFEMPWKFSGGEKDYSTEKALAVTPAYASLLGLEIVEGRFFDNKMDESRQNKVVINEAAKKYWGIEDISRAKILNKYWSREGAGYQVIGVVKDFNFEHLSVKPKPLMMVFFQDMEGEFLIQLEKGTEQTGIQYLERLFKQYNPGEVFSYKFLSDEVQSLYEKEKRLSQIYILFTIIAFLISATGLFAIALYDTRKRTKEIGVRKVNGATVAEILGMLNKDFIKWIALAFVIACPIAWYAMHKWLQNFAYKTTLSWWIFVLAGVLALGIALLTVSFQSYKAATRNPIESLRYE